MRKITLSKETERIVWIDVETDGLHPETSTLLQAACIITDGNLKQLNEGFEMKVRYHEDEVADMRERATPFVQEMHDKNGIWKALPHEGKELEEVELSLLEEIKLYVPEAGTARLGGNSITLDRNFLRAYTPTVLEHLHYRSYDMSSISGWFEMFYADHKPFKKQFTHDALDDIKESIAEGRHYAEILKNAVDKNKPPF